MTPTVPLDSLEFRGQGLVRPECVLATAAGDLYTADFRGGVAHIAPDGSQHLYLGGSADLDGPLKPNGIALEPDGSFLIAHLGPERGALIRLWRDGTVEPLLLEIDGEPLPPANFVALDAEGGIWLTVSTRLRPRQRAWRPDVADGFIVRIDGDGARIAADGIGYTNEVALHPDGKRLFVNETMARRVSFLPLGEGGRLGPRQTFHQFEYGVFPDGLAFDAEGGLWIVSVVSNQVIRFDAQGRKSVVIADADPDHVAAVDAAWREGRMERQHLDRCESACLRNISSLAFAGPDLRRVWLGCLLGDRLAGFDSPIAGFPPVHWKW